MTKAAAQSDDASAIVKSCVSIDVSPLLAMNHCRYDIAGYAERAAAWAVFNGDSAEAVSSLRRSKGADRAVLLRRRRKNVAQMSA
jgi:hypothetical protein